MVLAYELSTLEILPHKMKRLYFYKVFKDLNSSTSINLSVTKNVLEFRAEFR